MIVLAQGRLGQPGRVAEVVLDVDPARDPAHGEVGADEPDRRLPSMFRYSAERIGPGSIVMPRSSCTVLVFPA